MRLHSWGPHPELTLALHAKTHPLNSHSCSTRQPHSLSSRSDPPLSSRSHSTRSPTPTGHTPRARTNSSEPEPIREKGMSPWTSGPRPASADTQHLEPAQQMHNTLRLLLQMHSASSRLGYQIHQISRPRIRSTRSVEQLSNTPDQRKSYQMLQISGTRRIFTMIVKAKRVAYAASIRSSATRASAA